MRRHNKHFLPFAVLAAIFLTPLAIAQDDADSPNAMINVEAQPLADALRDFSDQTGLQLAYVATLADNKHSRGVQNAETPFDALDGILDSTGLEYRLVNDDTIAIAIAAAGESKANGQSEVHSESGNSAPAPIRTAQNQTPAQARSARPTSSDVSLTIEEIVVTATKRDESLRDVSISISAITGESLQDLNAHSLSDYITRVPGVVFNDYQPGVSEVVIRGVASTTFHEANQATTGYYLNQIPLIEPGFPLIIPDVDAFDLSQVEVLRGPQGTLFGSSSLGGAVNYVVNEADASGADFGAEGTVSSTEGVADPGYAIKGMVNAPIIEDELAVRVVALQRFDTGYLDNTSLGEDDSNDLTVEGYRGSVVYTPTDDTKISVLLMSQEYSLDDQTYVIFNDDPETFERTTNVAETQDTDFSLYSLRLDHDFSWATLTALGSYVEKNGEVVFDFSVFGGNDPRTDTPLLAFGTGESTTDYFEARLASNQDRPLRWLAGTNFTALEAETTDASFIEGISDFIDANPGQFDNQPGSLLAPGDLAERTTSTSDVTERAIFGELSYDLSDQWMLTFGGRLFEYKSKPRLQFLPNANLVPPFDFQPGESSESDFIPKVSVTYTPGNNVRLYALYSEGFRIGGANVFALASADLPLTFESDSTRNLEAAARLDLLGGRLLLDATVYHIDWDDIQARLFTPVDFRAFTTNGGGADIDGVEISASVLVSDWLRFNSAITYTNAELSALLPDSFAPGGGHPAGTQLPGASEWITASSVILDLDNLRSRPVVSLHHRYLSKAPVAFGAVLEKGGYHLFDLNATFTLSDQIEAGLFVKNVFDEYGILNAPFSFAGSVTRPRSAGVTLRYRYR